MFKIPFWSVSILCLLWCAIAEGRPEDTEESDEPETGFRLKKNNYGKLGSYSTAAVAADNGICSDIGKNIMRKRGGNAVDAIIASTICIGVLGAHSSGIGGGFVMTVYNRTTQTCWAMDARETAPNSAFKDMYGNNTKNESRVGWLSIGVPGEIYGLYTAFKLAGSGNVQWHQLFRPTIILCERGFEVTDALAHAIQEEVDEGTMKHPSMKEIFYNDKADHWYKKGEFMRRPKLAVTLENIAKSEKRFKMDPIKYFYDSDFTQEMVDEINNNGGNITREDFRNYRAKFNITERPVIKMKLGNDLTVCGPPPPSSASITMSILNILQGYDITPEKLKDPSFQELTYHRIIEAMKFGYGARTKLGDMNFVNESLDIAKYITSPKYAEHIRSIIDKGVVYKNETNYTLHNGPYSAPIDHGTTHVSSLDPDGNAVSLTSTVNYYFGARVAGSKSGIILNDEMDDFSKPSETSNSYGFGDSPANRIEPGKRPQSSMSPLIVVNNNTGDVKLVAGTAGGSRIITATAQLIMRVLWFGENLKQAVEFPRLHNQLNVTHTNVENLFDESLKQKLIDRGQNFAKYTSFSVASTGIHRADDGRIYAYSDKRKDGGYPAGY